MAAALPFTDASDRQRIYVECRLKGMNPTAAATAAGYKNPNKQGHYVENLKAVKEALAAGRAILSDEVRFSRKEAHEMYMEAYRNSANAAEQIAAVNALVKLHDVAKPPTVHHKHEHRHSGELTLLSDDDLLRLADLSDDGLVIEGDFAPVEHDVPMLEAAVSDAHE